jgi:hypothetical protein
MSGRARRLLRRRAPGDLARATLHSNIASHHSIIARPGRIRAAAPRRRVRACSWGVQDAAAQGDRGADACRALPGCGRPPHVRCAAQQQCVCSLLCAVLNESLFASDTSPCVAQTQCCPFSKMTSIMCRTRIRIRRCCHRRANRDPPPHGCSQAPAPAAFPHAASPR